MSGTRGLVVVKLGGTTVADQRQVLEDVADLSRGRPVAMVHGGGRRLTEWLNRLGVESRFEEGLRVTDDAAIEVAIAVLGGLVNTELVAAMRAHGAEAVGVTGVEVFVGERVAGLGRVARVVGVRHGILDPLLFAGLLPVIAPLAVDEQGEICNVNADEAAAGLAAGARARQLVLLTDVEGVLDEHGQRIATLGAEQAEALISQGVIASGMVPKVRACLAALAGGTSEAIIANGGAPHAVGRALTDPEFGTRLTSRAASGSALPASELTTGSR
jgi:acetylglutamate kinase